MSQRVAIILCQRRDTDAARCTSRASWKRVVEKERGCRSRIRLEGSCAGERGIRTEHVTAEFPRHGLVVHAVARADDKALRTKRPPCQADKGCELQQVAGVVVRGVDAE